MGPWSDRRRALSALALAVAGCGRHAEPWIAPDATMVVTESLERKVHRTKLHAKSPSRVATPLTRQEVRIEAPGRAPLTALIEINKGCTRSSANVWCYETLAGDEVPHPASWLRLDSAAFELPLPGQGVVVTSNLANTHVTVIGNGVRLNEQAPPSAARGSEPLVIVLAAPGKYAVWAEAAEDTSGNADIDVKAGEYSWVHFHLVHRPSYGSGWLR